MRGPVDERERKTISLGEFFPRRQSVCRDGRWEGGREGGREGKGLVNGKKRRKERKGKKTRGERERGREKEEKTNELALTLRGYTPMRRFCSRRSGPQKRREKKPSKNRPFFRPQNPRDTERCRRQGLRYEITHRARWCIAQWRTSGLNRLSISSERASDPSAPIRACDAPVRPETRDLSNLSGRARGEGKGGGRRTKEEGPLDLSGKRPGLGL